MPNLWLICNVIYATVWLQIPLSAWLLAKTDWITFYLMMGLMMNALPEDYILKAQSEINSSTGIPSSELLPSESVSQTVISATTIPNSSSNISLYRSQKRSRPAPVTNWLWGYFQVTQVSREWIMKRTMKLQSTDQDIRYAYINSKTGIQCAWKTTNLQRQTSTTNMQRLNMQRHLEKHSTFSPHHLGGRTTQKEQPSILDLLAKRHSHLNNYSKGISFIGSLMITRPVQQLKDRHLDRF